MSQTGISFSGKTVVSKSTYRGSIPFVPADHWSNGKTFRSERKNVGSIPT